MYCVGWLLFGFVDCEGLCCSVVEYFWWVFEFCECYYVGVFDDDV